MKPSDRDAYLVARIIETAKTVEKRIAHFSMTEQDFCEDRSFEGELAYDAVMNPVYRIAEDAVHLSDETVSQCPDIPWKNIRGFRNFVAHGYAEIDRSLAWRVVVDDIPALVEALRPLFVCDEVEAGSDCEK